jgi:hypothetical protein
VPTNPPTATPQPTPASYDFSIVSVRIQPNEKQDFNLTQAPLAQAKVNQKFVPAMYWTLRTNVPEGVPTRYQLAVREPNGQTKQIIDQTTTKARSADTYFVWVQGGLTLSVPGHYVFTWSVALNGVAKQGSTSIDILKKVVHRTIKRFAFVFNALHIQNNHGQNAQNFRPGDTVVISASYTVRNLKGTAPVIITKTLQTQIGGVWKPVSSSQESQDTASGTHFYKSSFQLSPGLTIPAIRIVVGISVASHLHVKKVIIHIIH